MDKFLTKLGGGKKADLSTPKGLGMSLHSALSNESWSSIEPLLQTAEAGKIKGWEKAFNEVDELDQQPVLHRALKIPNTKIVKGFLDFYKKHPELDINAQDSLGFTPLHGLVTNNGIDEEILKNINKMFPEIKFNCANKDKNTPLHFFCRSYTNLGCSEIGELLIKLGGGEKFVNIVNVHGETALHKACLNTAVRLLLIDLLINVGNADVNAKNDKGETALHYAVRMKRLDLVAALLVAGADILLENKDKLSPKQIAAQMDEKQVSDSIKEICDIIAWGKTEDIPIDVIKIFLKHEFTLQEVADVTDEELDRLGIHTIGTQKRIMKATAKLKLKFGEKKSAAKKILDPFASITNDTAASLFYQAESSISVEELQQGLKNVSVDQWVIPKGDLEFTQKLGEGVSGKVYKALLKGKVVAVKILKNPDDYSVDEFKKEFAVVSSINSPYIIKLLGILLQPQLGMVMEYYSKGSLYDLMVKGRNFQFDWNVFFAISKQICSALRVMHQHKPQILHRDLKSLNILVNDTGNCVLADFGLSRFNTSTNDETLMKVCGTVACMAPEVFTGEKKYTPGADVYSLAITLWEIIMRIVKGTYVRPYEEYKNMKFDWQITAAVVEEGKRPTFPPNFALTGLKALLEKGWAQDAASRPSVDQFNEELVKLEKEYHQSQAKWDSLVIKLPPDASPIVPKA